MESITIATAASAGVASRRSSTSNPSPSILAGDITTDTINIGTGSKLGLPYSWPRNRT